MKYFIFAVLISFAQARPRPKITHVAIGWGERCAVVTGHVSFWV